MTARDYMPAAGHILNKNRLYHNNFPRQIKIIKMTRAGFVHYQDATMNTTIQHRMSLHTLRKCFVLNVTREEASSAD